MKGMLIKNDARDLMELILLKGFLTNPNEPGVEKLSVLAPRPGLLTGPLDAFFAGDSKDALGASAVAYVKGWSRSTCFLLALLACYRTAQVPPDAWVRAASAVYVQFADVKSDIDIINLNRGR